MSKLPVPPPAAYSPEDMKRRKLRSVVMALCLAALCLIILITTIVRLGAHVADKVM